MPQENRSSGLGDAAVDGLLAGLAGGLVMAVFLVGMGWVAGEPLQEVMGLFSPSRNGDAAFGLAAHLAVSTIYGAVFGMISLGLRGRAPAWLAGAVYGLILYLIAVNLVLPGPGSNLAVVSSVNFIAAHLLYGLATGWVYGRNVEKNSRL